MTNIVCAARTMARRCADEALVLWMPRMSTSEDGSNELPGKPIDRPPPHLRAVQNQKTGSQFCKQWNHCAVQFNGATILLPVINETTSLRKTVAVVEADCAADVREFILSVCGKTTPESLTICESYAHAEPERFVLHHQKLPFIGGALREAFELARGSHVVMMASDLETEPATVKELIAEAKRSPDAIITTSRWIKGGGFVGYNKIKLVSNYIFQKIFSLLYGVRLTDMTYGFRILPTELVQSIAWEELRHPFFLETMIKPLRLGVQVKEIPTPWKARLEGESQNSFFRNFSYFGPGVRTRFRDKQTLVKPGFTA